MLFTILVVAFILGTVRPCLNTETVLLVFSPLASILSSVHVNIGTASMSLIIKPFSFVDISIGMDKTASAVGHVILPVALILAAVLPDLDTLAMSKALFGPLTLVNCSIIQFIGLSLDKFELRIVI